MHEKKINIEVFPDIMSTYYNKDFHKFFKIIVILS